MSKNKTIKKLKNQAGATLIEVLITIFVMSVGLLGLAGVALATISYNKVAQIRISSVGLANDLAERARMNVRGVDNGNYEVAIDKSVPGSATLNPDETNDAAAAAAVANQDLHEFLTEVRRRLPAGRAVVASDTSSGNRERSLNVWLLWQENATAKEGAISSAARLLFEAGQTNCPSTLSAAQKEQYSCAYYRIAL